MRKWGFRPVWNGQLCDRINSRDTYQHWNKKTYHKLQILPSLAIPKTLHFSIDFLLIEPPREKALLTLDVITEMHILLRKKLKISCIVIQNVCDALNFLLDNICIRFDTKL